jgi:hypothetical protein
MVGRLDLQDFKEHAEWRREKAQHYPNEERNLEAAAILDRLAAQWMQFRKTFSLPCPS